MNRAPLVQLPPALLSPGSQGERAGGPRPVRAWASTAARTKTLAAVLDLERHELHLGHGGPSNQDSAGARGRRTGAARRRRRGDRARGHRATGSSARRCWRSPAPTPSAVGRHVRASAPTGWIVVNDVVGAWATATGAQPGVGVISGTGSNVFGVGPDGRSLARRRLGPLLGDEGSGYWLGLQSIKAALRDREGSGPPTALSDAALEFFGCASVEALAALVYAKPLTKSEIAAFAIETAQARRAGRRGRVRALRARGARAGRADRRRDPAHRPGRAPSQWA